MNTIIAVNQTPDKIVKLVAEGRDADNLLEGDVSILLQSIYQLRYLDRWTRIEVLEAQL